MVRGKPRELVPDDKNSGAGVKRMRSGVSQRQVRLDGRKDSELDDQVRVIELWMEKFKTMGPCALDNVGGGRGCADERVIFPDMSHISVFEGVNQ